MSQTVLEETQGELGDGPGVNAGPGLGVNAGPGPQGAHAGQDDDEVWRPQVGGLGVNAGPDVAGLPVLPDWLTGDDIRFAKMFADCDVDHERDPAVARCRILQISQLIYSFATTATQWLTYPGCPNRRTIETFIVKAIKVWSNIDATDVYRLPHPDRVLQELLDKQAKMSQDWDALSPGNFVPGGLYNQIKKEQSKEEEVKTELVKEEEQSQRALAPSRGTERGIERGIKRREPDHWDTE